MASPAYATLLRLRPGCACLGWQSRVDALGLWRGTSGARGGATLGLCPIAGPVSPSPYVPAADERFGILCCIAAWPRGLERRRTHQDMVPYLASAFSPSVSVSGCLVMRDQGEVGALACGVIWAAASPPLPPMTGCPARVPPSPPRPPIGASADSLASGEAKCRLPTCRLGAPGGGRDSPLRGRFF